MRSVCGFLTGLMAILCLAPAPTARADVHHYIGVGTRYWMAVDKVKADNIDANGFSFMGTYQLGFLKIFKVEADLEVMPDGFAAFGRSDQAVYAPQIYGLVNLLIVYGGVGTGIYYSDGDWADAPFYVLRAGVDLPIWRLHLDLNANYRFDSWNSLDGKDINGDTVVLGAAARFKF